MGVLDRRTVSNIGRRDTVGAHDLWRVNQAATFLTGQACTLSARHINDGALRLQFNREVAYYARGIVRDVESGGKSVDEGLTALNEEKKSLLSQSFEISSKGVGVVAGALQLASGAGICYASVGTLCLIFGVPLMAHGTNNIYENGRNILEDRSDVEGPVRTVYRTVAKAGGKKACAGDVIYGAMDLAMSAYGTGRLVLKPDAWRLFRYARTDSVRAYQTTPLVVFGIDRTSDMVTAQTVKRQWECLYE
ncbi:DUF4225 domain-containing protein [Pseudomonas syringae]|uniref:DUF4225 domain-containing protein n=1 Tax=Pseudomonas syringae TaxID=317 RepID=UPI003F85206D